MAGPPRDSKQDPANPDDIGDDADRQSPALKEYLYQLPKMPDLFNKWIVSRIELNAPPWIQTTESGRKVLARDPVAGAWDEIEATDAWNDDQCRASYLLHLDKQVEQRGSVA